EIFFLRQDHGGSPNVSSQISAEDFFQVRNNATTHSVPRRAEILVRSVFAEFQPAFADVMVDLVTPNTEQRSHNRKIDMVDSARRELAHRGQAGRAGAP